MWKCGVLAAVLLGAMLESGQTFSQTSGPAGRWGCQFASTDWDRNGNRTGGHTREFQLALYPNGNYEAAGVVTGINGKFQFQSQGRWQTDGSQVIARGKEYTNNPQDIQPMDFMFVAYLQQNGALSLFYEQGDQSGTYLMSRLNAECLRRR